jgi:hypothetical protein
MSGVGQRSADERDGTRKVVTSCTGLRQEMNGPLRSGSDPVRPDPRATAPQRTSRHRWRVSRPPWRPSHGRATTRRPAPYVPREQHSPPRPRTSRANPTPEASSRPSEAGRRDTCRQPDHPTPSLDRRRRPALGQGVYSAAVHVADQRRRHLLAQPQGAVLQALVAGVALLQLAAEADCDRCDGGMWPTIALAGTPPALDFGETGSRQPLREFVKQPPIRGHDFVVDEGKQVLAGPVAPWP